jgi:hypothetical protein
VQKLFTVEEANRTLPLVRRIVQDIVASYRSWTERVRTYEVLKAVERLEQHDPRADELEVEIQALAAEIDRYIRELAELGVELRDGNAGLVDFPARITGRDVCLSWRIGEPAIEYWRERDAALERRQPLSPHVFT